MKLTSVLCFAGFLVSVSAFNFTVTDCSNRTTQIVRFSNASLSPSVVHFPGTETGSVDIEVLRTIEGTHYRLDVIIEKHILWGYPDLPCVGGIGSCTYDLCTLLSKFKDRNGVAHCPIELVNNNIPCTCPIQPGHYHLNPVTFQLTQLQPLYKSLAHGDFKVHAKLTNTKNGWHVGCYDIEISTDTGCTGLLCSIGIGRK